MVTAAELLAMQSEAERALPGTAVIRYAGTLASDGGGGFTETSGGTLTTPCRLATLTREERGLAERISAESEAVVTLPAGTDVPDTATIVTNGSTFSVTGIRERTQEVTRRVEVRRVS